jgi:hypothetical protein
MPRPMRSIESDRKSGRQRFSPALSSRWLPGGILIRAENLLYIELMSWRADAE